MSPLLRPAPPGGLAALRIGVAAVLLAKALSEWPAFERIYGGRPLVPWALSELRLPPGAPRLTGLADALAPYGVAPDALAHGLWLLYLGGLALLLPGLLTRPAAIAACVGHLLLHNGATMASYGVDYFANIGLFYCAVFPVGAAASLDRAMKPLSPPGERRVRRGMTRSSAQGGWGEGASKTVAAGICLRLLRAHLSLAYLSSGWAKATGAQWWSGEAVWRAVMEPQFAQFDLSWLARFPWVAQGAALATIVVEGGYAFFVWPRATRRLWLWLTVGMHLGIGIVMGLWWFSGIMIALNVAALGEFERGKATTDASSGSPCEVLDHGLPSGGGKGGGESVPPSSG